LAEAGKGSKTVAPLVELANRLLAVGDNVDAPVKGKGKDPSRSQSLMGKFADLKSLMPSKKAAKAD
jgi:pilus assembly protein CpaE